MHDMHKNIFYKVIYKNYILLYIVQCPIFKFYCLLLMRSSSRKLEITSFHSCANLAASVLLLGETWYTYLGLVFSGLSLKLFLWCNWHAQICSQVRPSPGNHGSSSHGFSFFKCIWKNQNGREAFCWKYWHPFWACMSGHYEKMCFLFFMENNVKMMYN